MCRGMRGDDGVILGGFGGEMRGFGPFQRAGRLGGVSVGVKKGPFDPYTTPLHARARTMIVFKMPFY